jgi:hypothetical protein
VKVRYWCTVGALALTGCVPLLFDDRCGPETRATVVRGDIRDTAGARIGSAEVSLTEIRGDSQPRQLRAILMGPAYANPGPLSRRVVRVRLLGRADVVLREFPFRHANEHEIIWVPGEFVPDAAEFEALERRFTAGEAVLELETDLPGMARLRVPLPLRSAGGWSRAHCS